MIRFGIKEDIFSLQEINRKWLWENLSQENREFGFLICDEFTAEDFEKIIDLQEIVVVVEKDTVVANYLFDNCSQTNSLKNYEKCIDGLTKDKKLKLSRLSKRAQIVIDKDFQRQGFYEKLVDFLHTNLRHKYDKVFSTVSKVNPKMTSHIKNGWTIVGEDKENYFVTHDI